jgi:hypothetical protein
LEIGTIFLKKVHYIDNTSLGKKNLSELDQITLFFKKKMFLKFYKMISSILTIVFSFFKNAQRANIKICKTCNFVKPETGYTSGILFRIYINCKYKQCRLKA